MIIQHNIMALNAHRQLSINSSNGSKSLEKLSSGFRINRAGDDAAGLAISEKMRGQIRGLEQASRNAQDGISLIQTAEGALNETHSILQRMRELAVQSSNDTNTSVDRSEIQKEINQLTSEINRIGNTTEFNTMKLLDGSKEITFKEVTNSETKITDGTAGTVNVGSALGVSFGGDAAQTAGWQASIGKINIAADSSAEEAINWADVDISGGGNNIVLTKTADDGLKIELDAVNTSGETLDHEVTIDADALKYDAVDGKYSVNFHGVSFDLDVEAFKDAGSTVSYDLSLAKGTAETNAQGDYGLKHDFTDPAKAANFKTFTIDGTDSALVGVETIEISTADAQTFTIKGYDSTGAVALLNESVDLGAAKKAGETFTYNENGINIELEILDDGSGNPLTFTTTKLDVKDYIAKVDTIETKSTELDKDQSLTMQIGANKNQTLKAEIKDMRSIALGIASTTGGGDFAADDANKLTDVSTDGTSEYGLDMSSAESASKAIEIFNGAIEDVSAERSKLGAIQNRLEHTINNLGTSAENLTAAESRIRDVDMAKEMMIFTKNNILQQAAQAMLAQANQQPQSVLQLLR